MLATKKELYEKYPNKRYYKLTNEDEIHNEFQFCTGLNVEFTYSECHDSGIYFTEFDSISYWLDYSDDLCWIREVTFPDDALIYIEKYNKFKADKLILSNRVSLKKFYKDLSDEIIKKHVKLNGYTIKYLDESRQTEEYCMEAINQNAYYIKYVHKPTEKLCIAACAQNGLVLKYIDDQTDEICKTACAQNGLALEYVDEQTDQIRIIACENDGNALKYIGRQTEEICKIACAQNGSSLEYVDNQTYEICIIACKNTGYALEYVEHKTLELFEIAIAKIREDCGFE